MSSLGVSRVHVKRAVLAAIDTRFPWLLEQAERDHGIEVGSLPRPTEPASGRTLLDDDPSRPPPYLIGACASTSEIIKDGRAFTYVWRIGLAAVVGERDYEATGDLAGVYALVLANVALSDPSFGGLAIGCDPVLERYDVLDSNHARTLASVEAQFDLMVESARDPYELPLQPPAAGDPALEDELVESTRLTTILRRVAA